MKRVDVKRGLTSEQSFANRFFGVDAFERAFDSAGCQVFGDNDDSVIVTDDEVTSLNGDSADAHWSADSSCRSPLLSRPLDAQPGREHRESDLTKIFGIADMAFDDQTTQSAQFFQFAT